MSEQQPRQSPLNIPDAVYNRVFQRDSDGAAILQELSALFYDVPGYMPGQSRPEDSVFTEGCREVVRYIMGRCAQQEG